MVDSKKPGDKPRDNALQSTAKPSRSSLSNAEKAARAKAFVTAQKEDQKKSDQADYSDKKVDKAKKIPRTGFLWIFVLCTLGLSGAAGYGVYYLWQQWQVEQSNTLSLEQELQDTQSAIANVRDNVRDDLREDFNALQAELGEEATTREEELTATQNTLALLEKTVGRQTRQMQALTQTNRDEWLLAETEYLLRLANQRILMSKEIGGALAMLQSADRILREIDDVSLVSVRRAIADDIAALSRSESVDVDGEYLQLASLTKGIDELKLYDIPEFSADEQDEPVEASMPEQPTWRDSVARVGAAIKETLGKVFVVRQRDQPVEAMLPPQQELYLRQNLRLMLEQSQLALLARKPAIYEQSLDKAQQWIARYFIGEDAATQAALETLEHARTINIDPPLPDISGSYRALKDYTNSEYSRKIKAEAARQEERQKKSRAQEKAAPQPSPNTTQEQEVKQEAAPQEQEQAPEAEPRPNTIKGPQDEPKQKPAEQTESPVNPGQETPPEAAAEPLQQPDEESAGEPETESPEGNTSDELETSAEEPGADAARGG